MERCQYRSFASLGGERGLDRAELSCGGLRLNRSSALGSLGSLSSALGDLSSLSSLSSGLGGLGGLGPANVVVLEAARVPINRGEEVIQRARCTAGKRR